MFEDDHLRSSKLSEEELRSKIGDLNVSTPTLGSSSSPDDDPRVGVETSRSPIFERSSSSLK